MGVQLSTSNDPAAIPYFLWDEPIPNSELRLRLQTAPAIEKHRLLAKIMRQGRETDVWRYTTPSEVVRIWSELKPMLGRRLAFWEFLLDQWQNEGLIDRE